MTRTNPLELWGFPVLFDDQIDPQSFHLRAFGSTYETTFTGRMKPQTVWPDDGATEMSLEFSVTDVEIVEITPEDFHEGAD